MTDFRNGGVGVTLSGASANRIPDLASSEAGSSQQNLIERFQINVAMGRLLGDKAGADLEGKVCASLISMGHYFGTALLDEAR